MPPVPESFVQVFVAGGWVMGPLAVVALLLYGLLADRLYCAWIDPPPPGTEDPRRGLAMITALVAIAPLLGLLGTVSGVISCFRLIVAGGRPGPDAAGIAEALVSTLAGLLVAVPAILLLRLVEWGQRRRLTRGTP
jgi:biopolymer transport protein ExbB